MSGEIGPEHHLNNESAERTVVDGTDAAEHVEAIAVEQSECRRQVATLEGGTIRIGDREAAADFDLMCVRGARVVEVVNHCTNQRCEDVILRHAAGEAELGEEEMQTGDYVGRVDWVMVWVAAIATLECEKEGSQCTLLDRTRCQQIVPTKSL